MRIKRFAVRSSVGVIVLISAASIWASSGSATTLPTTTIDIAGTYELTKRVMLNGEEIRPPAIVALYTLDHGRGNCNLFVKNKDGSLASESTISRYILTLGSTANGSFTRREITLTNPESQNAAPPVKNHCTHITSKDGRIVFAPPGEGVESTFDSSGFTATIVGQFVDHWRKIR